MAELQQAYHAVVLVGTVPQSQGCLSSPEVMGKVCRVIPHWGLRKRVWARCFWVPYYCGKLSPVSGQLKRYKACLKPWREHVLERGIKCRSLKPRCKGQWLRNLFPVTANACFSLIRICPSYSVLSLSCSALAQGGQVKFGSGARGMRWMKPSCSGCV